MNYVILKGREDVVVVYAVHRLCYFFPRVRGLFITDDFGFAVERTNVAAVYYYLNGSTLPHYLGE